VTYVSNKCHLNNCKHLQLLLTYHGRGYVYSIQYHIVWCVKYRHKILTTQIETKLIEILNKIAEDNNFNILEINGLRPYTFINRM